jgi:hypothetical protein
MVGSERDRDPGDLGVIVRPDDIQGCALGAGNDEPASEPGSSVVACGEPNRW